MFGMSRKERYGVVTLVVALDEAAAPSVRAVVARAAQRIVDADGRFEVASAEVAAACAALLDHLDHATHVAHGGEEVDDEAAADAFGQEQFADLSTRYLSSAPSGSGGPSTTASDAAGPEPGERRFVAMVTVGYAGQAPALETDLHDRDALTAALREVVSLHHADRLLLAHVHGAPAHADDKLTDEQMLVCFPELMAI
jgi:hypothetical protein